jgi:exonuclease SbcC
LKLLRLRVVGLRSFTRETEIDLSRLGEQGLFAICGPTGAGKSTILDGIFLALFGRCPRGEASECVSAGALDLVVRLELSLGSGEDAKEVAVERRFRWAKKRVAAAGAVGDALRGAPKHPPLRIEERAGEGWAPVDLGGRKADEYLAEQIVKVSMGDFQQAVVLPQGEFDALLRARPAERRTLVASLFRTEHLGQPLLEVLRGRETSVRSEIGRLEEAEREVLVSEEEALAATARAEQGARDAEARAAEALAAEGRAVALRLASRRCEARDAAAAALAGVASELEARAEDRARVERGKRAAGAQSAVEELARAEAGAAEAEARSTEAEALARDAEARRQAAVSALAAASAARAAELPRATEQLGRARQALERGRDLDALDAEREARARDLAAAARALRTAEAEVVGARATLAAAEAAERQAEAKRDRARVGEDERAEAVAGAAVAELLGAEARLSGVIAAELGTAAARVAERTEALAAAELAASAGEAEAARLHAERRRLEVDAQRAAQEIEVAERALDEARRAAAAADLAAVLRAGDACPVCGAREHPGADHRTATITIDLADRGVTAARRIARAADASRATAARDAGARDEEARALGARVESVATELSEARASLSRQRSGEEVPRAVAEARAAVTRLAARAELALGGLEAPRRDAVREAARHEPPGAAEARITALNQRARDAEELGRALAAARARSERARAEQAARAEHLERAERSRAAAEGRAEAAASAARARREEIDALIADLAPRGQRGLFEARQAPRSAAAWVDELSATTTALVDREEAARAALEEVRALRDRLALGAREASARHAETAARRDRARDAVGEATARAGFESLAALREAVLAPAALAALETTLEALTREHERLAAVLAERRRDADVEVTAAEALAAERARDEARREATTARERAAQAATRSEEIARRRARALELRRRIDELEPRAKRLGQIRAVVASNQLSELAAERHLEAVTRGAATLLRALSGDRYALVRTAEGAFAVADAAHGGLVRPPSTLSGGETFLVSLALALALSERIQLAGRTRFDFFFLDEGFGSLDAATLDVALAALEALRGPSRVIGMISHVPAIEERMPRRLRVGTERQGGATTVTHEP